MDTNEINRQIQNGCRKGTVIAVEGALCRVASGALESNWIQWFCPSAGETSEWLAPSIGELVALLCPGGDPAQALAVRGLYSDEFPPPSLDPNKHVRRYPDGAWLEYDFASHALKADLPGGATVDINAPGAVVVKTGRATVQAEDLLLDVLNTTITGNLLVKRMLAFEGGMTGKGGKGKTIKIEGGAEFTEDVKAGGKSLSKHRHREQGDGALVGEPE